MQKEQRRIWVSGILAVTAVTGAVLWNGGQRSANAAIIGQGNLTAAEQNAIFTRAQNFALTLNSSFRSVGSNRRRPRLALAFVSRDGRLQNTFDMPDTWTGADDLAIGKARTAAFFSSNENALTSRVVGQLSQAHDPKTGEGPAGPFWGIWSTNQPGVVFNGAVRNSVVTQAGGVPIYRQGVLIGGVGVAGDNPDIDEQVAFQAITTFFPPANIAVAGFPQ